MKLISRCLRTVKNTSKCYSTSENLPILSDIKRSVPNIEEKKKKESFMKNVFLGKYDEDFIHFPEINDAGLLKELSYKSNLLSKSLNLDESNLNNREKLKILAQSGFLSSRIPKSFGGLDLRSSELVTISENIVLPASLSVLLEVQQSIVQTVLSHGSADIKKKYLSKLLSGEIVCAYALNEENVNDPLCLSTSAILSENDCILNGEKICVSDAQLADVFIVFAKTIDTQRENIFSVFLVDKNDVKIEQQNTIGSEEFGFCKIVLNNVSVPITNMIGADMDGFHIALKCMMNPKFFVSTCIVASIKEMLSQASQNVNLMKLSPSNLVKFESDQYCVAKLAVYTYALESMLYFTSGILDQYEIDSTMEAGLLYVFSIQHGLDAIENCLKLLNFDSCLQKTWYNLKCLPQFSHKIDVYKMYVALLGLEYAAQHMGDSIRKSRNPFNFPFFIIQKLIENKNQVNDNPKLILELYQNCHPYLKTSTEQLEYCVLRLKYVVENVLIRHGSEVRNRQLDLYRIFNIALDIYAMNCVVSRASRAYCTGIRDSDKEVLFAKAFCQDAFARVKKEAQGLLDGGILNNDALYLELSGDVLKKNSYFFEHPLKLNIS